MTSLAHQNVAELGGGGSVLSRQKRDHIRLDELLHRLSESGPGDQDATLLEIYRLVFPHAYAEETVLWPVIRRVLPDGHELTLRIEMEHQEINELAVRLESPRLDSDERGRVLDRLVELLRQDVRDEEDELLPRLQMKLTTTQLRRLGVAWEAVRLAAPTRPHAVVSRRPPGNVLAALPLTVLDHCRDGIDILLHRGAGAAAPSLETFSRALARASHAVERLPGMRRGEEPATRASRRSGAGWGAAAIVAAAVTVTVFALRSRAKAAG